MNFLKMFPNSKRIVVLVLLIIIFIRVGYIFLGEAEKEYYTSGDIALEDTKEVLCRNISQTFLLKDKHLDSVEFILNGISEKETGFITVTIFSEGQKIYQTNLSLKNIENREWKQIFVNLTGKLEREYKISFDAQDCVKTPNILLTDTYNASSEALISYSDEVEMNKQVALKYRYLGEPTKFNKGKHLFFCCISFLIIVVFLYYIELIYNKVKGLGYRLYLLKEFQVIATVLELGACIIILHFSKLELITATKIVFYLISVFSVWKLKENKIGVIKGLTDRPWKRISLYMLYVYGAFCLVGQRLLIYPLNLKVTALDCFVFLVTIIWFIPVVDSLIYVFDYLSKRVAQKENKKWKNFKFLIICLVLLLLPAGINLYAYNPGISTEDTFGCMVENAHNLRGMLDWHPAFYCMVLKAILNVWDSTYSVIFVQYFFWAYVMAEGIFYLRKKGIRDSVLLAIAFLLGICPANFLFINTIWKDIPYTLSILWSVIILAKLTLDFKEYKRKWYIYLELFVSLNGIFLYRKNGIVPFILIVIAILIFLWKNKRVLVTLAITMAAIVTIKGPVYQYFEVENPGKFGIYIGLSQDILGVYYAGGEVSEETLKMINIMTSYNIAEYDYVPTWSRSSYRLNVQPMEFIKNYLNTFIKNPIIMTRAIIAREDLLWNVYPGQDAIISCVNCTKTMDDFGEWNNYYPRRVYNNLYPIMARLTAYSANNQLFASIIWRCGFLSLLTLGAILIMIWTKGIKRYLLITIPIIGHILSLLLSTGWTDFRYFWPINIVNVFLLLFINVVLNEKGN
ncbi:MAG: hypothetical protein HFI33_10570 [Lachnospiraceae bacterium]|nr:hypothetical protein [Lachnospiraceae bacterium]